MHRFLTTLRAGAAACLLLLVAAPAVAGVPQALADSSSGSLPADPAARGYIGLCDEAGRNISGGSIDAAPFVWKAVASQAPPKAYTGTGQNAVLAVYQPRPGVPADQWSAVPMTAASFYAGSSPATQSTYRDTSLEAAVTGYPALVDGLYELRMTFGKRNYGLYSATYPTTTIQVIGSAWHVVSGGTVDCSAAHATSDEQLTGFADTRDVTPRTPATRTEHVIGHTSSSTSSGSTSPTTAPATLGRYTRPTVHLNADGKPVSAGSSTTWVWLLVPLALVVALGGVLLRRRSTRSTPG